MFDTDQFVADVFLAQELAVRVKNMGHHLIIMRIQQNQQVISSQEEVLVFWHSELQLIILWSLGDDPAVMDELSPIPEVRVHDDRHEVVFLDHFNKLDLDYIGLLSFLLSLFVALVILVKHVQVIDEGVVEGEVPVDARKEGDCAFVLHELEQVLVILYSLIGNLVIHRYFGEVVDLLHDGVGLLIVTDGLGPSYLLHDGLFILDGVITRSTIIDSVHFLL